MIVTPEQYTFITEALGHEPNEFEQKLYLRLARYLSRDPDASEVGNMITDSNLAMWVLTDQ